MKINLSTTEEEMRTVDITAIHFDGQTIRFCRGEQEIARIAADSFRSMWRFRGGANDGNEFTVG
jgi:hypothetical protein